MNTLPAAVPNKGSPVADEGMTYRVGSERFFWVRFRILDSNKRVLRIGVRASGLDHVGQAGLGIRKKIDHKVFGRGLCMAL